MTNRFKFIITAIAVIISTQLYSQAVEKVTPNSFCNNVTIKRKLLRNTKFTSRLSLLWNMSASPQKLIRLESGLDQNFNQLNTKHNSKKEFVIFSINKISLNDEEKYIHQQKLDQFNQSVSQIKETLFFKGLRKITDYKKCLDWVEGDLNAFEDFLESYNKLAADSGVRTTEKRLQENRIAKKTFQKMKNTRFYENIKTEEILLEIKDKKQNIVIIAHADSEGNLYDSQLNKIPKYVIQYIERQSRELIIFSCHGDEVLEKYQLKYSNVFIPIVKERFRQLLGTSVPMASAKIIKKIRKKDIIYSKSLSKNQCQIKISYKTDSNTLAMLINNKMIGVLSSDKGQDLFHFQCDNNARQTITLIKLSDQDLTTPVISNLDFVLPDNSSIPVDLKHFSYLSKYTSSKGAIHFNNQGEL